MGPGEPKDWDEGEVAEDEDSSRGELGPEGLALGGGGRGDQVSSMEDGIKMTSHQRGRGFTDAHGT